jgi:hypothetical protein
MLDLETLGTRPGAIVLCAAFVRFSDFASVQVNLSIPDQQALGMHSDPSTEQWWRDLHAKDPGAWPAATQNPVALRTGLEYLAQWIAWATGGGDVLLWAHGKDFDPPLLGEAYRLAGLATPWPFWSTRDTRTLYDLAGVNVKEFAVPPPHIALNDAIGQTRAAIEALRRLAAIQGVTA